MSNTRLTSKELMARTGLSRATLNNYVAQGILPRPDVRVPAAGDGRARRLGYFPTESIDIIEQVGRLKKQGLNMSEITATLGEKRPSMPQSSNDDIQEEGIAKASQRESIVVGLPFAATAALPGVLRTQNLSIDNVSGAAYMLNNQFEVEWSNDEAETKLFGTSGGLSEDITECSIFPLLLNWPSIANAADRDEILRFHLMAAKNRIPRSRFYTLGSQLDGEHVETLLRVYDETEAADRATLLHTTVNMAPSHEPAQWYILYASFFREGVFFTYSPTQSPSGELLELLGRRDIVIRELLKRRRPYLTPLAVMVADIQNSVKICAELPPEEYFELINCLWSTMEPILRKYHATHGKHVGDGILCYFFPQPDSHYVLNAIRCSLEMQKAMADINREWRARKNWANDLLLNIGMDEGQEWFGTYQTNTHLEFTVLGDTVNRGGRLSDFATGGAVWGSKNLLGKLSQSERDAVRYGIDRTNADGNVIFVESTFSRISNLVDLEASENQKLSDLGALPVTEIRSITG